MDETVFLDGSNIWTGPQILEMCGGESTGEAVDDVPLVGDRGTVSPTREGVDMGFTINVLLEGDNVSSSNGFLGLVHLSEGGRSRECGESAESEDGHILWEHVDDAR